MRGGEVGGVKGGKLDGEGCGRMIPHFNVNVKSTRYDNSHMTIDLDFWPTDMLLSVFSCLVKKEKL